VQPFDLGPGPARRVMQALKPAAAFRFLRKLCGAFRDQVRQIDGESVVSALQFNFQKYNFRGGFIEHVVLDPRLAKVGFSETKLRL
jgi:hypothetical protein